MAKTKAIAVRKKAPLPVVRGAKSSEELVVALIEKGVNIDQLTAAIGVMERLEARRAKTLYYEALSAFQSEIPEIIRSRPVYSKDGKVRYRFAPIGQIVRAIQPLLKAHGLSYVIHPETAAAEIEAHVTVHHSAGHEESTKVRVPVDPEAYMNAQQKIASALSYATRYALCAALGIVTSQEDDDAITAGTPERVAQPRSTLEPEAESREVVSHVEAEIVDESVQEVHAEIVALIAEKAGSASPAARRFRESADHGLDKGAMGQLLALRDTLRRMRKGVQA